MLNLESLKKEQIEIARRVKLEPLKREIALIGGCDVSYSKEKGIGVWVVMGLNKKIIEFAHWIDEVKFPYIPNFLSFREIPFLMSAYEKLSKKPDLIFVDGQGILHPRGVGLATHLGVILKKPTIGCAKSKLIGEFTLPPLKRGRFRGIKIDGETRGAVLVTRDETRPIYVSPGNKISLKESIKWTLRFSKLRVPEPIRNAHRLSKKIALQG